MWGTYKLADLHNESHFRSALSHNNEEDINRKQVNTLVGAGVRELLPWWIHSFSNRVE